MSDDTLMTAVTTNRAAACCRHRGTGVYQTDKYAEDADEAVAGLYREHGYIEARVGQPELRPLGDSRRATGVGCACGSR